MDNNVPGNAPIAPSEIKTKPKLRTAFWVVGALLIGYFVFRVFTVRFGYDSAHSNFNVFDDLMCYAFWIC